MPGRKCCVPYCQSSSISNKKEGISKSYFSFPRDGNLRKKWIEACHKKIENFVTARVCSDHFKDEDFFHNKSDVPGEFRKKRLKFNVVPSLNLVINVRSEESLQKKFCSKNSYKENSKELLRRKIVTRDSENIKEVVKRQINVLSSGKENAREPTRKKNAIKRINGQKSYGLPRKKISTGNISNENLKERTYQKGVIENDEDSKVLSKLKTGKGGFNKENTKGLIKKKNNVKKGTDQFKDISKGKNGKSSDKQNPKEPITKKKSSIFNTRGLKDPSKRKIGKGIINKGNPKEVIKKKNVYPDDSKEFYKKKICKVSFDKENSRNLTRKRGNFANDIDSNEYLKIKISKGSDDKENPYHQKKNSHSLKNNVEFPKDLNKQKTDLASKNKESSKIMLSRKNSMESVTDYLNDTLKQEISIIENNLKKPPKRKSSVDTGMPKKLSKKRIRLGKSDSEEDSDDNPEKESIARNNNNKNGISKHKITYKSPSEMEDNVDLLKYLNYLKEKSSPSDQPILFWVDD